MAKETETQTPKKRRFYHNLKDAYTMVKRTFPWLGWALLAILVICVGAGIIGGILLNHWISYPFIGILLASLLCLILLTALLNPALYDQLDGRPGAVGAVLSRQSKGWIVYDTPAALNQHKDLVWRAVGRAGVVLISEGPSHRVTKLLDNERRKIRRLVPNAPIHVIQYGEDEGQISLSKVAKKMRAFKHVLTKSEVPAVDRRLQSLRGPEMGVPKGIDPNKARPSKRSMYGR